MSVEIRAIAPRRAWRTSVVGVLLALGFFSLPFGAWIHEDASVANHLGYELIVWAWVAAILLYVLRVERRPLSSIGFRAVSASRMPIIAILAGILILALLALISFVVFPALHWSESSQEASILALPYWLNVLIVMRAAVSEEILFRGYPIERLEELTGSRDGSRRGDLRGVHARSRRLLGLAPHIHCGLGGGAADPPLSLAPQHLGEHDRAFRGGRGRLPGVSRQRAACGAAHETRGVSGRPIRCKPARRRPDCGYNGPAVPAGGP